MRSHPWRPPHQLSRGGAYDGVDDLVLIYCRHRMMIGKITMTMRRK